MDNNELDKILKSRFSSLRTPPDENSIADRVVERIAESSIDEVYEVYEVEQGATYDWLLWLAFMLGALVCATALQDLSFADFDATARLSSVAMPIMDGLPQFLSTAGVPLLFALCLLPLAFVLVED